MAMLGFMLRYQDEFRDAFLRTVCGHVLTRSSQWQIELEVDGCGDLALSSADFVAVVEFKIDAPLDDHQLPDASRGYWDKIEEVYAIIPRRDYIVVQKELPAEPSVRGQFKTWHDVRDACHASSSPLINDLFESLASLNIPAFSHGKTSRMKLAQNAQTAAQVFKLLENVTEGYFSFKKTDWDVSDEDQYIGKNIFRTRDLGGVQELLQSTTDELAWYGYEGEQLSVWFYAGPKGTKVVRKRLEAVWPGLVIVEGTGVGVRIASEKVQSDQLFFERTLGAVFPTKLK